MSAAVATKPDSAAATSSRSSFIARLHAWLSLPFLLAGVALLLAAHGGLVWPDWAEGSSFAESVGYGRAFPMALNSLVFGWVTLGLLAGLYHLVPRLVGGALAFGGAAAFGAVLVAAGVGTGVAAIGMGEATGGRLLEMPWYADLLLLAGFLIAAVSISTTVRRHAADGAGVAAWYAIAAPWWLFLAYGVGSVPGLTGAQAELQSAFTGAAVFGMWIAPAAVGIGYALIASIVPDAGFHPRLGRIGFWSLGFLWVWTAARTLQYGPTPDWMETVPILFSIGLLVAALTIVTDFALAIRGRLEEAMRSSTLRLFAAGAFMFLLLPGHMVVHSLRSSSAVVRFTAWESAFDLLAVAGAFTFWTAAAVGHVLAPAALRRLGGVVGSWAMLLGVLFAVGTRWIAGLQQGYTWLGGVESGLYENFGDGFRNTTDVLVGTDRLTFVGLGVFAAGALLFVIGLALPLAEREAFTPRPRGPIWLVAAGLGAIVTGTLLPVAGTAVIAYGGVVLALLGVGAYLIVPMLGSRSRPSEGSESVENSSEWAVTERPSVIRIGAAAVFALVAMTVFVLPALDLQAEPSLLADSSRDLDEGSSASVGRELYVSEGCWYCHTQQVRAIVTDLGLGPVSVVADYVYDPPGVFGVARLGPDLAHAGSRSPTDDPAWVAAHLTDPRAERHWSTMPSYAHLSGSDLSDLAAYVAGLE